MAVVRQGKRALSPGTSANRTVSRKGARARIERVRVSVWMPDGRIVVGTMPKKAVDAMAERTVPSPVAG